MVGCVFEVVNINLHGIFGRESHGIFWFHSFIGSTQKKSFSQDDWCWFLRLCLLMFLRMFVFSSKSSFRAKNGLVQRIQGSLRRPSGTMAVEA